MSKLNQSRLFLAITIFSAAAGAYLIFNASAGSTAALTVESGQISGVKILGSPSCAGIVGANKSYRCVGQIISTMLYAPETVTKGTESYRFKGWTGCEQAGKKSSSCKITVLAGASKKVRVEYVRQNDLIRTSTLRTSSTGSQPASAQPGDGSRPIHKVGNEYSLGDAFSMVLSGGKPRFSSFTGTFKLPYEAGDAFCKKPNLDNECDLRFVSCSDTSCTASPDNRLIDAAGNQGQDNDMAIGPDNKPVISYYEGESEAQCSGDTCNRYCDAPGFPDNKYCNLKVAKCNNAACTSKTITRVDTSGPQGKMNSIAVRKNNNPVIVYTGGGYGQEDLILAICSDPTCSSGTRKVLASVRDVLNYHPEIELDSDGNPTIFYSVPNDRDWRYRIIKCVDKDCSQTFSNTVLTFERRPVSGTFVWENKAAFTLRANDRPLLFYRKDFNKQGDELKNHQFRLFKCGNKQCTSNNEDILIKEKTADDPWTGGVSIAVGPDGLPLVTYISFLSYERSDDNNYHYLLNSFKCSNVSCSSGRHNTVITSGQHRVLNKTEIAINSNNIPFIGYYDHNNWGGEGREGKDANDRLRVFKCKNTTCSP